MTVQPLNHFLPINLENTNKIGLPFCRRCNNYVNSVVSEVTRHEPNITQQHLTVNCHDEKWLFSRMARDDQEPQPWTLTMMLNLKDEKHGQLHSNHDS